MGSLEQDLTNEAWLYADSVMTHLTLEERIGQCIMPSLLSDIEPATLSLYRRYIDDYHVGGVVLLKGTVEAAQEIALIGHSAQPPLFIAIDAEWGLGMRLTDANTYPKNGQIDASVGEEGMYDYGRQIAKECKQIGINMVLGPVVDIVGQRKGFIGNRSFGADPVIVSDFGVAYSKGLESGGVMSVAKHFPGHGSATMDTHRGVGRINRNITSLDSLDLKPFRLYINSGLSGIMAGHLQALSLDPDGRPASVSMDILTSLLREEMGFKGLILTDAFDMGGAQGFSAAEAINAGADIILCPLDVKKEIMNIRESIDSGNLDVKVLNDRCRRILFYKYLFLQ